MRPASAKIMAGLAQANRAAGRLTGFKLSRAPIPGSLNAELDLLLERFDVTHVLDVGAHRGRFALGLRRSLAYRGSIASFEPDPDAFSALSRAAARDPHWEVQNTALGSSSSTMTLVRFASPEMNSLRPLSEYARVYAPGLAATGEIQVPVERLDAVWRGDTADVRRTLLKSDTQGFDLDVVRGAGELMREIPAVVMEVANETLYEGAPAVVDVLLEMRQLGFEPTGWFPIHRYAGGTRVIEFDCTLVNVRRC